MRGCRSHASAHDIFRTAARACCVGAGGEEVYVTCLPEEIMWKRSPLTAGVLLIASTYRPHFRYLPC